MTESEKEEAQASIDKIELETELIKHQTEVTELEITVLKLQISNMKIKMVSSIAWSVLAIVLAITISALPAIG